MPAIAIYAEGGGDGRGSKDQLRQGMEALLGPQKEAARQRRLGWKLVVCGGRGATCDAFLHATRTAEDSVVVLLVDAEEPLRRKDPPGRVDHLTRRDGWDLSSVTAERVHLMVQCMEAWIVADREAVTEFYGQGFLPSAMPTRQDLEEEPKQSLYDALKRATLRTQKGEYGKIAHASALLKRLHPERVAKRCPCFANLTAWLDSTIAALP
jgi:hypothetical protein